MRIKYFFKSPLFQRFGQHGDNYQAKVISKNNFYKYKNEHKSLNKLF